MMAFGAGFNIIFICAAVIIGLGFIFTILMMVSPKFKGKMMSRQVKAAKYMMEDSKEDLKEISDDMAYASKDSITTATRAIKKGLKDEKNSSLYCKNCGSEIDADSRFCKKCGKEQY